VRYERRIRVDGRIQRPDVAEAIEILRGQIAGGVAYESRLTSEEREAVFREKGDRCLICGDKATDIDHIDSAGSNDMSNLQPLCAGCHRTKTISESVLVPLNGEELERMCEYQTRVGAPVPIKPCDDERTWRSVGKAMKSARKKAEVEHLMVDVRRVLRGGGRGR
jgi:hypothetical protein